MSQVRFEVADLAEIRFCVSPLWETVTSLWALADPARHACHRPWIGWARAVAARPEIAPHVELLAAFARPKAPLPDFLTPPPRDSLVDFADELGTVRGTPPEIVAVDIASTHRPASPLHPLARAVAAAPAEWLPRIADAVEAWWLAAILPHWPRMRALLEADIAHRSRQFADGGPRLLFDTLHPSTSWAGDRLLVADPFGLDVAVAGSGLPLRPSLFLDHRVLLTQSDWNPPSAVYPARAVGTLWEHEHRTSTILARLLGANRARLLALCATPTTTTALAARTGLTPGSVSQHLAVLLQAGLLTRHRHGREVHYTRTELGHHLLAPADPATLDLA
ncbi:transcriptional regulator [Longispora fulva]|uniref:DNA-binding transcriptional ArsR family regulator n=1 Tax=Longispora fulva TaxID=619741 RepID=A0A8J7GJ08_9ACTN|nr:helix-turn-helix domain-containing protein [Longispora fulva]MBG6137647.1 DNA-binding transcriptional ArsR family regulator [Longispora fulva]GIG62194.1 transcriptional regulator [Longispora fulva]